MKNYIDKLFITEGFDKITKTLDEFPPFATEIQVFREGYDIIMKNVSVLDNVRNEELLKQTGYLSSFSGIRIFTVEDYCVEMKTNQAKVIYNDGSSKIIDLFK